MNARQTSALISILATAAIAGCGGSDPAPVQTGTSIDPQVFKQNAETYLNSLKGMGGQLASCVTQSLTAGAIGGPGGNQQAGPGIESCIQNFLTAVKAESNGAQGATLTYLKGVTSPCKEKVQAFEDNIKAITDVVTKAGDGKDVNTASKLIATIQGGEVQGKLRQAKATFTEATKVCSDLVPKKK